MNGASFDETLDSIRRNLDQMIINMDEATASANRAADAMQAVKQSVELTARLMVVSIAGAVGLACGFVIVGIWL